MELIIENAPDKEAQYQAAFKEIVRELWIARFPNKVILRFYNKAPNPAENVLRMLFGIEPGELNDDSYNGNARGSTSTALGPNGEIMMTLNESMSGCGKCDKCLSAPTPLAVFCHEMVHVSQMLQGRLRQTRQGVVYNGRLVNGQEARYENAPWEQEADEVGSRIYNSVVKRYDREIKVQSGAHAQ